MMSFALLGQSAVLQTLCRVESLNRNFDKSISTIKEAGATGEAYRKTILVRSGVVKPCGRPWKTIGRCRQSGQSPLSVSGCKLLPRLEDRRGEAESLTFAAEASLSRLNAEAGRERLSIGA